MAAIIAFFSCKKIDQARGIFRGWAGRVTPLDPALGASMNIQTKRRMTLLLLTMQFICLSIYLFKNKNFLGIYVLPINFRFLKSDYSSRKTRSNTAFDIFL